MDISSRNVIITKNGGGGGGGGVLHQSLAFTTG